MSEDMPETVIKDPGAAYLEALAVKNETAPTVERIYSKLKGQSPENERVISPLKETGYLELGAKQLQMIKENNPDYYFALTERRDAISRFAATLKPSYSEIKNYINPRIAQEQADALPAKDQLKAEASAQQTAESVIDSISSSLMRKKAANQSLNDDSRMMEEVTKEIQHEMAEGHVIDRYSIRPPQIGALTEGIWATLEANRQEQRANPDLVTNVTSALEKQALFDQSTSAK